jgi:hypothetical protein
MPRENRRWFAHERSFLCELYFRALGASTGLSAKRPDYQQGALTGVKLLGCVALLVLEQGAIIPRQYEQITKFVIYQRE